MPQPAGGKNAKSCYLLPWGLFLIFCVLGTFFVTMLLGAMAIGFFGHARRWGRGPWPAYFLFFGLTVAVAILVGVVLIMTMQEVAGAPGDEFFEHVVLVSCCIAAVPGLGMLAGLLGLCFRRCLRTARDG